MAEAAPVSPLQDYLDAKAAELAAHNATTNAQIAALKAQADAATLLNQTVQQLLAENEALRLEVAALGVAITTLGTTVEDIRTGITTTVNQAVANALSALRIVQAPA